MGAKQSRASKQSSFSFYVEGESAIPQPGMKLKSINGNTYRLIKMLSETDNSFNFLAAEWSPSVIDSNSESSNQDKHNQSNQMFVIKFIKLLREKLHMIENELTMMQTFAKLGNNNHIVECFDFFVYNNQKVYPYACLVTPYAKGGTLLDHLHQFHRSDLNQPSLENTVKKIMHQLLQAVKYLHSNNVAHRDLNLKNILLLNEISSNNESLDDIDPIVVVTDFGCSTFLNDKENCEEVDCDECDCRNGSECDGGCDHCKDFAKKKLKKYVLNQLVGTPVFIAPEMYSQKPYGPEVDIWSLGIIFYALISGGSSPFPSSPSLEVMKYVVIHKQIDFSSEKFNGVSEQAMDLLKKMLKKDPSLRITAEEALNHPWFSQE